MHRNTLRSGVNIAIVSLVISAVVQGEPMPAIQHAQEIQAAIDAGEFIRAEEMLRAQLDDPAAPIASPAAIQFEILRRTRRDFPLTADELLAQIKRTIPLRRWRMWLVGTRRPRSTSARSTVRPATSAALRAISGASPPTPANVGSQHRSRRATSIRRATPSDYWSWPRRAIRRRCSGLSTTCVMSCVSMTLTRACDPAPQSARGYHSRRNTASSATCA